MTVGKRPARKRATVTVAASPASAVRGSSAATAVPSAAPAGAIAAHATAGAKAEPDAGHPGKPGHKLVRDSFTIPKSEYAVLESLKLRAAKLGRPIKKSEALRAGVAALQAMSDAAFLSALGAVPSIKTGRPKKSKPTAKVEPPTG